MSAGGDLKYVIGIKDFNEWKRFYRTFHLNTYEYFKNRFFQISIFNGHVNGAGTTFTINSDVKVATEKTSFAMPECKIGYIADAGSSYYFTKICNKHLGMYLSVTGRSLTG
jgi:enoyl-CoA hydratase/carnithine racemase